MRAVAAASSTSALPRWRQILRIFSSDTSTPLSVIPTRRQLAQVRAEPFSELWFTATFPPRISETNIRDGQVLTGIDEALKGSPIPGQIGDHKPPDERTLKLGRTLRKLSPLLPDILTDQLPQELLSPSVSLHLFPSTHPHLPVVKGRIPYKAALWTAPVAWGCVPVVGNVKLDIVSEKIVRSGFITAPSVEEHTCHLVEEKLVVKWRTKPSGHSTANATTTTASSTVGINKGLSTLLGGDRPLFSKDGGGSNNFSGLFIFSFDEEGRIANHTIEHADEASGFDKTSRIITLSDWLLGKAKWRGQPEGIPVPGLAFKMRTIRDEVRKDDWRWKR